MTSSSPADLSVHPWRLLESPAMDGAANMGLDEALMRRAARFGECTLRVYTWSRPTLSLGRNQAARGRIDPDRAAERGVDIVRRPTGGRALLHHREVTYSVTAPLGRGASARAWYDAIGLVLLDALRALGAHVEAAATVGRTPIPRTASCFQRPDAGEIVVGGRKLVGSALLRQEGALLQHGSILLEDDQGLLVDLLPDDEAPPEPAGTLHEALGSAPQIGEVAAALFAALRERAGDATPLEADAALLASAAEATRRYQSDAWTYRE